MLRGMPAKPATGSAGLWHAASRFSTFTCMGRRPDCSADRDGLQYLCTYHALRQGTARVEGWGGRGVGWGGMRGMGRGDTELPYPTPHIAQRT